jgi:hypothetical protein
MTQEELEPVDPITQAQTEIDAEQGGAPPVFTQEQVQQMIQAQLGPLQDQLRGVQGLTAKALDAHRGEWEGELANLQNNMGRAAWLNNLDESERNLVTPLLNEIDQNRQQAPVPTGPPNVRESAMAAAQVWGINPADPRINYALADQGNEQGLVANFRQIIALDEVAKAQAAYPARQASQAAPQAASPPVVGTGAGPPGSYNSLEEVRGAFITDTIDIATARQEAKKFGEEL